MKRIVLRLSVALAAFCVGVGCELVFKGYAEATSVVVVESFSNHPKHLVRTDSILLEMSDRQVPAGSLPKVLQRIDQKYKKQCQLPTNWSGDWPMIKELAEFRGCNDRWAMARHKAITAEIANYLVQY